MGKWLPAWRTGTKEQCQALRQAAYNLFRHNRYEQAQRIRVETPHWADLNDRYAHTERGLTRTQIAYHRHVAANAEDRDMIRLQRTADRQRKQQRRTVSRSAR